MWLTAAFSWITGPFKGFLKSFPKEVWYVLFAAFGIVLIRHGGYRKGKREGEEKVEKIKEKIVEHNDDVKEAVKGAEDAVKEFEERVGGELTTDELNLRELRKLTRNDPNNVGPSVPTETD